MIFQVVNKEICIGSIRTLAVASSSLFLVGDTHSINLSSTIDTPPESVGPVAPLPTEEE
ncbi:hypothetical protein [Gorillibacterium massiliense]|uniref:hypothetical protein n=1 Tax=Gorillibacterium massiliense TaxID=1280390 RepID=UPI00059435A3|nr:hypothetical protein [Gorillibacterium massiliense]